MTVSNKENRSLISDRLRTNTLQSDLINWATLSVVATSLQILPEFKSQHLTLQKRQTYTHTLADNTKGVFGTVLECDFNNFHVPVGTTLSNDESLLEDYEPTDLFVMPKYSKELKIKVGAFIIDRTIPKIFID